MQNSVSDIYIYNSTGRPLNGGVNANSYTSLVKQLDIKRNALYFESTGKQGEFLLGCSLRVERVGGREERVVCIAVSNSGSTPEIFDHFYSSVKEAIKKLDNFNYKIIGMWEEGDLDTLKEVSVPKDVMQYVFGKVLVGNKVSIKSNNPVAGILLIRQLSGYGYIRSLPPVKMVLSVSQYPIDNLVSISPMEPKPDFELDTENLIWKQIPDYKDYYFLLAETLVSFPIDVTKYKHLNLDSLSTYIKNRAFQEYRDKILEIFISTPESVTKFFELYINQKEVVCTFVSHWSKLKTEPLPINDKLAGLIIRICSKKDSSYPSNIDYSESECIRRIYDNIRSPEVKKVVDIDLLKNNLFCNYALNDTITGIYKENDTDLLNALFSVSLSDNSTKKEKFKKLIDDDLNSRSTKDLLTLRKIIANNMDVALDDGGKVFFESLIAIISNRESYLSKNLSKKELGDLKGIFGKEALSESKKQQTSSSKTGFLLKTSALGVIVLLLIGTAVVIMSKNESDNPNAINSLSGKNQKMINNDMIVGNDSTTNNTSLSNETIIDNSDIGNIIDFSSNVTSGSVPLSVQFSDQTENATGWLWDFGDGGNTSNISNPIYLYERPGEYNVSLMVFFGNTSENLMKTINITVDAYGDENSTIE